MTTQIPETHEAATATTLACLPNGPFRYTVTAHRYDGPKRGQSARVAVTISNSSGDPVTTFTIPLHALSSPDMALGVEWVLLPARLVEE